jgi:hypothetical protein
MYGGKRAYSYHGGQVNEEKGSIDNVGTEWVAAGQVPFTLGYYWSNRGLLRQYKGPPIARGDVATMSFCTEH